MQLSIANGVSDTKNLKEVSLEEVIDIVRNGERGLKDKIENLRQLRSEDEEAYGDAKCKLIAVTPSGTFTNRNSESLLQHSGLICLDFDKVLNPGEICIKAQFIQSCVAAFISPSGHGAKLFIRVDPIPTSDAEHKIAWEAVSEIYTEKFGDGIKADPGCKDVSRLCFLSHDPYLFYDEARTEAVPWEKAKPTPIENAVNTATKTKKVFDNNVIDESILDYIPADDYDNWLRVGMACHAEGLPMSTWENWSRKSNKFADGICERKWKSFKHSGNSTGKLAWGSIVKLAEEYGYQKPLKGVKTLTPSGVTNVTPSPKKGVTTVTPEGSQTCEPTPKPPTIVSENISHQTQAVPAVETVPQITVHDTEIQRGEKPVIKIPDTLFTGIFGDYVNLFDGKTEVPKEYHFASLFTGIGAVCGKRYYIDEGDIIYPNAFTAIVGKSALARKSTALRKVRGIIEDACSDVFNLRALSTPEGLINLFVDSVEETDEDENGEKRIHKIGGLEAMEVAKSKRDKMRDHRCANEGFRIFLTIDEISLTLKKASKQSSAGLLEILAEAFNMPSEIQNPTKVTPASAENPCLSILGATTFAWFEKAFQEEDIHGGIANRFIYFYDAEVPKNIYITLKVDPALEGAIKKEMNGLRHKFQGEHPHRQVPFTYDNEYAKEGAIWYKNLRKQIGETKNPFVAAALGRADLYQKKAALIHAITHNSPTDTVIGKESLQWSIDLMQYLVETSKAIYTEFTKDKQSKIENRIIAILKKYGWLTASRIHKQMSWASRKDVNATLFDLTRGTQLIMDQNPKATKYAVAPDSEDGE